jgi:hypothetical protein
MGDEGDEQFEAEAQIGKGLKFIDRQGSASIGQGRLTLRTRKGDVIAEGPLSEVWAEKARFSGGGAARISVEGES